MIRRAWFLLTACGVLLLLIGVLGLANLRMRSASSRLPERGSVVESIPGCPARVEVVFDGRGIPHVSTGSPSALWFAQGYLHARDRYFQMEMARSTASGRLAEIFGESALDNDRKMRVLRLGATARRQAAQLMASDRSVLESYSDGVNAAIAQFGHWIAPEIWLLGIEPEPWVPEDSLAISLLMQLDLSWSMGMELRRGLQIRRLGQERATELWGWTPLQIRDWIPPGDAIKYSFRDHEPITHPTGSIGSNAWAIAPERTATGRPLLATDPHHGIQMPGAFFAIHLTGPGTHVAGLSVAGTPGVLIGHNESVAWGLTMSMVDDQDLFVLTLDDSGTRELVDGRWRPLRTVTENIYVRWQESPELIKIRLSVHGPMVREQRDEVLALAWTALNGPSLLPAVMRMYRTTTVGQAAEAWRDVLSPSMNLVAADTTGDILHQVVGQVPKREAGAGRLPSPGSDSRWAWKGFRPMAENPSRLNPEEGFIASASQDLFGEGEYPERERYPADFAPPWRSRRLREVLAKNDQWTVADCMALQTDEVSGRAIAMLKIMWPDFSEYEGLAVARLMEWDAVMDSGSDGAALYARLMLDLGRAVSGDEALRDGLGSPPLGPEEILRLLAGGLDDSWWDDVGTQKTENRSEILAGVFSRLDNKVGFPSWGEIHTVHFQHQLTEAPGLGRIFSDSWNRGPFAVGGGNVTVNAHSWNSARPFAVTAIPAARFVADVGNWDDSVLVLPVGQSGRPWSPHYADQIESWIAGEPLSFAFSEAAVTAAAVARMELRPGPREKLPEETER